MADGIRLEVQQLTIARSLLTFNEYYGIRRILRSRADSLQLPAPLFRQQGGSDDDSVFKLNEPFISDPIILTGMNEYMIDRAISPAWILIFKMKVKKEIS